jgi:hypothetical protein
VIHTMRQRESSLRLSLQLLSQKSGCKRGVGLCAFTKGEDLSL